jgi:hypothetical protein
MDDKIYIFLDIDGVLNSQANLKDFDRGGTEVENVSSFFMTFHVEHLNEIIRGLGGPNKVLVILSATMRNYHSLEVLQSALEMKGFIGKLVGKTGPNVRSGKEGEPFPRAVEIQTFLDENPHVKNFLILDDAEMNEELTKFAVRTSFQKVGGGLREHHVRLAIHKCS